MNLLPGSGPHPSTHYAPRQLAVGEAGTSRRMASPAESPPLDVRAWSDATLVDAVRGEQVNERALDVLVERHWKRLFGRCRLLTRSAEEATDLAQSAWCRVLRARRSLDPQRSFAGYLATVATNLWRDRARAEHRAGPLAAGRIGSLDAPVLRGDGTSVLLADVLPDPRSIPAEERMALAADIDRALARLTPRQREVLIARFLDGESTAEIAKREGRSEQAVSGWVREALAEMKVHLRQWRRDSGREDEE